MDIDKNRNRENNFSFSLLVYAILSILMDRLRVISYHHAGHEDSLVQSLMYGVGFFSLFIILDRAIAELYRYLPEKCHKSIFYQRPLASFNLLVCGVIGYFVARFGIDGFAQHSKPQNLELAAFAGMAIPLMAFIPLVIIEKVIIHAYKKIRGEKEASVPDRGARTKMILILLGFIFVVAFNFYKGPYKPKELIYKIEERFK